TPAVRLAAHNAARELLGRVAEKHEWKADELEFRNGLVVRKDGKSHGKTVSFEAACQLIDENVLEVNERRPVVNRRRPNYQGFQETNAGVQFAEVEVDVETGEVRVIKVVAVQDCGKIINPKTATSQIRGGVIGGVSYALFERRTVDRQEGRVVNADMENYKILGAKDMPEIDVVLLDVWNGKNNTGVMGLGEPPTIATAAAIANAVYNAIGVRIESLPITPAKVLEALARKETK
ncbi:MAG: xanthine dehydrogenase family protein molybdopterin-binding subunit, partial [Planctomycetes bacterium]|nr:xanthine dehydrogenase family protein molybdopterin-binding subunit [Planctomycetota bacterium]